MRRSSRGALYRHGSRIADQSHRPEPQSYWGRVWSGASHAFTSASRQFVGEFVNPSPTTAAFGPFAHAANFVNGVFSPLVAGASEMLRPVFPERDDAVTQAIRRDARAGNPFAAVTNPTASEQRAMAANLGVAIATGRMPFAMTRRGGITAPINTREALQRVTDQVVADLAANPRLAERVLSRLEYARLAEGGRTAAAQYGNAVERLTADYIVRDPALGNILRYQSRPFRSTPDFFGFEGYNLRSLEITTARSTPAHTSRPYGAYTEIVTHPGLPPNLVFPR